MSKKIELVSKNHLKLFFTLLFNHLKLLLLCNHLKLLLLFNHLKLLLFNHLNRLKTIIIFI